VGAPQIDAATLQRAPYSRDVFALPTSGPVAVAVNYTALLGPGPNSLQLLNGWVAAINAHVPLNSIFSASVYCEVRVFETATSQCDLDSTGSYLNRVILTAASPGLTFDASVSVQEACGQLGSLQAPCHQNESTQLAVSISTTAMVAVPESITIGLFALGLMGATARRRTRSLP
jgi:hypothetical protein